MSVLIPLFRVVQPQNDRSNLSQIEVIWVPGTVCGISMTVLSWL